jgi:F-type H+-transporting ATPase subunit delta
MNSQKPTTSDLAIETEAVGPAGQYAAALLDLATEDGQVEQVGAELEALVAALKSVPDFAAFCVSPVVPAQRKAEAMRRSLNGKLSPLTLGFLSALFRRGRGALLGQVADVYRLLEEARRQEVHVRVDSAVALSGDLAGQVAAMLSEALGSTAVLDLHVDPSLLGGLRIRVGSKVVDASLSHKMDQLKAWLEELRPAATGRLGAAEGNSQMK